MSSQESLNYLIGNFVSNNVNPGKDMTTDKMVCIDTSNGFLGFNTIDPSYEIDVVDGTIRTKDLFAHDVSVNNKLNVLDVSVNNNLNVLGNLILPNIARHATSVPFNGIYCDENGTLRIRRRNE